MSIFTSPPLRVERRSGMPLRGSPGVATIGSMRREIDRRTSPRTSAPGSALHDARAHVVRVEAALLDEVVDDDLVGLDDAGEAAGLDRHVGERGALVERASRATPSPANSSTLPMPSPALEERLAEEVEHHVLGA